ncbi:MAG TPA: alpha-L-fucosidase [Chthonomonadales bacterium]|nr:alpha-L-fucosidase [Chthonomonadales bacterium]
MSPLTRRSFFKQSAALAAIAGAQPAGARQSPAFEPNWESLAGYKCPDWFRDAKFGIWAHWSAQCVPEQGDWYARQMYIEGNPDYRYQCAHYGHPSKVGFKDIDRIWTAARWDPQRLISRYKAAGARYFVALANHHDNFDTWNSKHQPWNAVRIGPKRDIVGTWERAARAHGLRFGVTVHCARTWSWFEVAQGADKQGPLAGVPYDGVLRRDQGEGAWWNGLDPQDLYAQNHAVGAPPDAAYCRKFGLRVTDLIDSYHPDLLYFDDSVLPLNGISDVGLKLAAHFYNDSVRRNGSLQAVMNCKDLNPEQARCMVHDFERGRSAEIVPYPWQTDTCIGEWHYRRSLYENHRYKTPEQVVRMLVDIISKNGNLLLNIPVRGDGTIDPDEEAFVDAMTAWMKANSEAIHGTRPWRLSGEGPVKIRGGGFSEGGEERLSEHDFRFVAKGSTLYATAFGWPATGAYTIRTLASGGGPVVRSVRMLGTRAQLKWQQGADGLVVNVPEKMPCDHAWTLRLETA